MGTPMTTVSPENARLVVQRDNSFLYLALDAQVAVNGVTIAALPKGQTTYHDMKPGRVTVDVSHPQSPGKYSVSFDIEKGQTANVEVAPRGDSFMPFVALGVIGQTIDSSVNEQSGLFMIKGVSISGASSETKTSKKPTEPASVSVPKDTAQSSVERLPDDFEANLRKLHELLKDGILTQEEFDKKKAELLNRI